MPMGAHLLLVVAIVLVIAKLSTRCASKSTLWRPCFAEAP